MNVLKSIIDLMPPLLKAVIGLLVLTISIGWGAAMTIHLVVKAEVAQAKSDMTSLHNAYTLSTNNSLRILNDKMDKIYVLLMNRRDHRHEKSGPGSRTN